MMNFRSQDQQLENDHQLKNKVKMEYEKAVQNISFSDSSKQIVLSSVRSESFLKKIINKLSLLAEYEINIPIKAYAVGAVVLCIICGFMLFQDITVSSQDISEAKINYINSTFDLGGSNDKN